MVVCPPAAFLLAVVESVSSAAANSVSIRRRSSEPAAPAPARAVASITRRDWAEVRRRARARARGAVSGTAFGLTDLFCGRHTTCVAHSQEVGNARDRPASSVSGIISKAPVRLELAQAPSMPPDALTQHAHARRWAVGGRAQPVERVLRALAAILADDPTQVVVVDCEHWTNDVLSIVYVRMGAGKVRVRAGAGADRGR